MYHLLKTMKKPQIRTVLNNSVVTDEMTPQVNMVVNTNTYDQNQNTELLR